MRHMIGGLVTCGMALWPSLSFAQAIGSGTSIVISPQLDRDDAAGARVEPELVPQPVRAGVFAIQPIVSVVGGYSSNVFNRRDARSDATLFVMPALRVTTDLAPHRLDFRAGSTIRRFERYTSENSEEFDLAGEADVEFTNHGLITASASVAHLIEPRSSVGTAVDAAEPVSFQRLDGSFGLDLRFGSFRLAPSAGYQRVTYDPLSLEGGAKVDESFRDTEAARGTVRISYDFSDLVSGFASGSVSDIRSTASAKDARRDARGISALAGLKGALTPLLSGEIAVGYQSRRYELPIYRDFSGVTFAADLQWYVTPLMTLRLEGDRSFQNSGFREVAGILNDRMSLTGYYDPLRNLRVALSASYERGQYREVDTRTDRTTLRFNTEYRLSPRLSFGGYLTFIRQAVHGTPLVSAFTSASAGIGISVTP